MKREFVDEDKLQKYGIKRLERAFEVSRSTLYRWLTEDNEPLNRGRVHRKDYTEEIGLMKDLLSKKEYCTNGHRRIHNLLKRKYGIRISRETVRILMRENGLSQRVIRRRKGYKNPELPEVTGPNQMWQIDMTIGYLSDSVPVYTVGIIDVFTRKVLSLKGYYRSRSLEWLECLDEAVKGEFPSGKPSEVLILGSDNGCQPTSRRFMQTCKRLNISIHYSGYKNPRENGYIERFFRTLKEEHLWLESFSTIEEYNRGLEKFREFYNSERMHSSLDYIAPLEFIEKFQQEKAIDLESVACSN